MKKPEKPCRIEAVLFDFGGVLAEEGFYLGLKAIAQENHLEEDSFLGFAHDLIHTSGYLTGRGDEHVYWQSLRDKTGIEQTDEALRNEILSRFILRPWMLAIVTRLKEKGIKVGILSDQTDWLDELNARDDIFKRFDVVYNSYHLGKSKVDPSHFKDTIQRMGVAPDRILFIDDKIEHCKTAREQGIHAIHYTGREAFLKEFARYCPDISLDHLAKD